MTQKLHMTNQNETIHCKHDQSKQNLKLKLKYGIILMMIAIFFISMPGNTVKASSRLNLYNYTTKKNVTYTDKQVKVTYNGSKISVDSTPGILMNGSALVSYSDVFKKSAIKAECIYIASTGKISISKNNTTIVMTINSKTALVNGKAVTMPVAPVKIKYRNSNVTKVLVPSRFVSETLGFKYIWNSSTSTAAISKSSLLLSYDGGKKFEYSGTLSGITIDGVKINLGNMPNIMIDNTVMVRAKKVFADSNIGASYSYNSKNKTITLLKNDVKLIMTIGSPVATLNGKTIMMDTAPVVVTNHDAGVNYIMVPGSFTASCLGYDYSWNKNTVTSAITSRKSNDTQTNTNGNQGNSNPVENTNPAPELGDTSVINEPGVVIHEWKADGNSFALSSGVHELNTDIIPTGSLGYLNPYFRDYNNDKINAETYVFTSNTPIGKIISTKKDQSIEIQIFDMFVDDNSLTIGSESTLIQSISTQYQNNEMNSKINISLLSKENNYDLKLSEDKLSLSVTVYSNYLEQLQISSNSNSDMITLIGNHKLGIKISEQPNLIMIEIPNTFNGIGDKIAEVLGSNHIKIIYSIRQGLSTRIILERKSTSGYYVSENENQFTLTITGVQSSQPQPVVIDKSKYNIVIPKPMGVQNELISHVDYYYSNRFAIKIPGDFTSFYSSNLVKYSSSIIKEVSVRLNSKNETEILFTTTRLQGYEFVADNNNIYVRIGNPQSIYKNIVILDAGHGGTDPGAIYNGIKEKDLNFKILYQLGSKYFNAPNSKIKVYFSRDTDTFITLADRAALAQKLGADIFVSLHMNAATSTAASGTEVYYSDSNNTPNKAGLNSKALATLLTNNLSKAMGTSNRGAKAAKYTVVHKNTVPAVLVELGFMSNSKDFKLITDANLQEKAAKTIYDTLVQVFELYPTRR